LTDDHLAAAIAQVLGVGVALRDVAQDGDGFALEQRKVGVFVVINSGGHGDSNAGFKKKDSARRAREFGAGLAKLYLAAATSPRTMAIRPVRTSSLMPKGRINSIKASILRSGPEISIIRSSGQTSKIRPRKTSTSSLTSLRLAPDAAFTLSSIKSRSTKFCELMSKTWTTVTIFSSCLPTCSKMPSSPTTTKVIRDNCGSSVSPTAKIGRA